MAWQCQLLESRLVKSSREILLGLAQWTIHSRQNLRLDRFKFATACRQGAFGGLFTSLGFSQEELDFSRGEVGGIASGIEVSSKPSSAVTSTSSSATLSASDSPPSPSEELGLPSLSAALLPQLPWAEQLFWL